ncbi:zinc knuckle CX2CX4HX4C containing protein [Tanacetum coccineum]
METLDKLNVRERNDGNQGAGAFSASCDGSLKAISSTNFGDLDVLIKDIIAGKHDELLSGMTNDMCEAVMDALVAMCDSIQANNTNADAISCKILHVDDSTIVDALVAENLNVDESPIVLYVSIQNKPGFYIAATGGSQPKPSAAGGSKLDPSISKANLRSLFLENLCEGVNVSIPRKVVETVSTRFINTLYGYFIGKRIAFLVMEYYVRNNWGLEDVLKKWSMSTCLCKAELTRIPVWVKIHDVPIQVFSEDGLSIIASQIGKPIMLDSYTSSMCTESLGRSSFARCLIEINAEDALKKSLTIGVPLIEDTGFTIETVTIKYDWKPPRCDLCKIFGYVHHHCPKKMSIPITVVTPVVPTPIVEMTNDGFQTVKQNVRYEPKATTSAPKKGAANLGNASKSSSMKNQPSKATITSTKEGKITMPYSYAALEDESDEDVENVYDESANLFRSKTGESSSTFTTAAG